MDLTQEFVITDAQGTQFWFADAEHTTLHRVDGPAMSFSDGTKAWYKNGLLHRIGGPAFEYANGTQLWMVNGNYHRTDGPAVVYANGVQSYWLNGVPVNEDEYPLRAAELSVDLPAAAAHRLSQLLERYESKSPLDILVDLLHYCQRADVDFEELLTAAQTFVHEEASMPVQAD